MPAAKNLATSGSESAIGAAPTPNGGTKSTPSIVMTGHDYAQARISMRSENALSSA